MFHPGVFATSVKRGRTGKIYCSSPFLPALLRRQNEKAVGYRFVRVSLPRLFGWVALLTPHFHPLHHSLGTWKSVNPWISALLLLASPFASSPVTPSLPLSPPPSPSPLLPLSPLLAAVAAVPLPLRVLLPTLLSSGSLPPSIVSAVMSPSLPISAPPPFVATHSSALCRPMELLSRTFGCGIFSVDSARERPSPNWPQRIGLCAPARALTTGGPHVLGTTQQCERECSASSSGGEPRSAQGTSPFICGLRWYCAPSL